MLPDQRAGANTHFAEDRDRLNARQVSFADEEARRRAKLRQHKEARARAVTGPCGWEE